MEKTENGECRGIERIVMETHIYSNLDTMHLSRSHSSRTSEVRPYMMSPSRNSSVPNSDVAAKPLSHSCRSAGAFGLYGITMVSNMTLGLLFSSKYVVGVLFALLAS